MNGLMCPTMNLTSRSFVKRRSRIDLIMFEVIRNEQIKSLLEGDGAD